MKLSWEIMTAIVAFGVTAISGIWLVPFLKRLKYGQTILDIGPKWHKAKQGTPTMGGLLFILGITAAAIVGWFLALDAGDISSNSANMAMNVKYFGGIFMALCYGFIGFIDDYIKVVRKRNLGLTAKQKLLLQTSVAAAYLAVLYIAGDRTTRIAIPFAGSVELGLAYYPFAMFVIIAIVNAVNLTDGLDGLSSSVTFVVAGTFVVICSMLALHEINILAIALAAGCIGFLVWNFYPAKVFMGDTGSLFLGGMVCALGFGSGLPVFLALIGIIYVAEAGSVVLQVLYFKATGGKRLFKMSPIHHHFEMCGKTEVQIVFGFALVSIVFGIVAVLAATRL